jgi:septum formation protein
MKLVLASASPRRKEILTEYGYEFSVITSNYEEKSNQKNPKKLAVTYAESKAQDVFNSLEEKEDKIVLGADTVVFYKGEILGKPKNEEDAFITLKKLSNKTHKVITGYALIGKGVNIKGYVVSKVKFNNLSDQLINEYIKTKSPLDKAGAYGIQDDFPLVKKYKGSLKNIIGLPIEKISKKIDKIIKAK